MTYSLVYFLFLFFLDMDVPEHLSDVQFAFAPSTENNKTISSFDEEDESEYQPQCDYIIKQLFTDFDGIKSMLKQQKYVIQQQVQKVQDQADMLKNAEENNKLMLQTIQEMLTTQSLQTNKIDRLYRQCTEEVTKRHKLQAMVHDLIDENLAYKLENEDLCNLREEVQTLRNRCEQLSKNTG